MASFILALFTRPIGNTLRLDGFSNGIRDSLFASYGGDGEFIESVWTNVLVLAVVTLNGVRNLEACERIKEGYFITEKLDELMGVTDAFSCRHGGTDLDTFVQGF